jgi:hypothetical protein
MINLANSCSDYHEPLTIMQNRWTCKVPYYDIGRHKESGGTPKDSSLKYLLWGAYSQRKGSTELLRHTRKIRDG